MSAAQESELLHLGDQEADGGADRVLLSWNSRGEGAVGQQRGPVLPACWRPHLRCTLLGRERNASSGPSGCAHEEQLVIVTSRTVCPWKAWSMSICGCQKSPSPVLDSVAMTFPGLVGRPGGE